MGLLAIGLALVAPAHSDRFGVGSTGAVFVFSAEIAGFAEEGSPLGNHFAASGFNDGHDVPQRLSWNARIIIAQIAFSGAGDPDFCGVF